MRCMMNIRGTSNSVLAKYVAYLNENKMTKVQIKNKKKREILYCHES